MKEYITKDRAKQFVCGHCNEVCSEEPCEPSDCDWMAFIDKEPAADVMEVVRCRECKYWGDEDGKLQDSDEVLFARCKIHNYLLDGRHTGWCPTENDFCSYGERKDGDGNG